MNLRKLIRREIMITAISVILISITFFSVSYAIYMTVDEREIGTLTFADLYFESCSDSTCEDVGENLGNSIINVSSVPLSDTEGVALDPYSFKVSNYGNLQLITYVYVSIDTTTSYDFSKLKVAYKESASSDYTISSYGSNEIFLLYTVTLDPNDSKIIDVLMWASEEMGNDLLGQNFNAYVNAVAYYYPADEDNLHTVVPTGTNTLASAQFITQFSYTGNYQTYTVPATGWYNVELWGAQGGATTGAYGAYTKGTTYLDQGDVLYVYVGSNGSMIGGTSTQTSINGGYNGGAGASNQAAITSRYWGSGGGATDIRLTSSINSRIMVAGGGGGCYGTVSNCVGGGFGGALIGQAGQTANSYAPGPGATQINGGLPITENTVTSVSGTFGVGGGPNVAASGGGGGYYGGSGSGHIDAAGGGSSFISGYAGVNAITSSSSTTPTNNTKHYSNDYFINGKMLSGVNSGNGKAKITFIGVNKPARINTELDGVRYIKSCVNGSTVSVNNHWLELQAIYNGTNVAYGKTVTGTVAENSSYPYSRITDGDITTTNYAQAGSSGLQCITVDLTQPYDLDEIALWRYWADGRTYYNNTTYVSDDNSTWTEIINEYSPETSQGKRVSAYEEVYNGYVGTNLTLLYDGISNGGVAHNASATTWKNLAGSTLDGTLNGTPVWGSNYLTFDGVNDWVAIAAMNYANPTIEVVAEVTTAPGAGTLKCIFSTYETGGYGLRFDSYYRTVGGVYVSGEAAYELSYSPRKFYLNRKYHLAFTYNGTDEKLYADGKDIYTFPAPGTIGNPVSGTIAVIGANPNSSGGVAGDYLTGKIYSVRVYNRALTTAEIKHNYEFDKLYYGLN